MSLTLSNLSVSNVSAGTGGSTPPSGDPYWTDVSFLLETATPSSITDATGKNSITNNSVTVNGSVYQVGTSSAFFIGGNLRVAGTSNFSYGSGDFTIEFWMNTNYASASGAVMFDQRGANIAMPAPTIYTSNGTNLIYYVNGVNQIVGTDAIPSTDTWYFVALSKNSGSTKLYVNGTQVGSTFSDGVSYTDNLQLVLGTTADGPAPFTGYMQQVRITKGVGRYPSNFTAPTQPFPTN
jgi:hypothetical protein